MKEHRSGKSRGGARAGTRARRAPAAAADPQLLYGVHSVLEACKASPGRVREIFATTNVIRSHGEVLARAACPVTDTAPARIAAMLPAGAVHQGLAARCAPLPELTIGDLGDNDLVLVLDQVTDPHNVGAILRSAAAFAAGALIVPARGSPEPGGVLAKSASGGLEHVLLIRVTNLARALEQLNDRGYMTVGFDSEAAESLDEIELTRPLALVLGAEGKGLRRLTREKCTLLARLDMPGAIKSLNVSNAAVLALYAARLKTGG